MPRQCTTSGAFAATGLPQLLAALVIFGLVVAVTRFVSLGSILASLSLPLSSQFWRHDLEAAVLGLALFCLIVFRHSGNIRRLARGQERKLGERVG